MNILDEIVAVKREEVTRLHPLAGKFKQTAIARKDFRDFAAALRGKTAGVTLVAEIKKASPSAGVIQKNFDAIRIARAYEAAGASALSILTDEKFFQGRIEFLQSIRESVTMPLLRKDFIIDEVQVHESVARGADAILLIVAILDAVQLKNFIALASQLRVTALVEVHHELELDRALAAGADIIGINNRDLRDFSVDLATTERLAARIPKGKIVVAESGINSRVDVERVRKAGVNAVLVGESLMRSGDIAGKVKELIGR